jgi:hypothetical protein
MLAILRFRASRNRAPRTSGPMTKASSPMPKIVRKIDSDDGSKCIIRLLCRRDACDSEWSPAPLRVRSFILNGAPANEINNLQDS